MSWADVIRIIGFGLAGGGVTYVALGSLEWIVKRSKAWR